MPLPVPPSLLIHHNMTPDVPSSMLIARTIPSKSLHITFPHPHLLYSLSLPLSLPPFCFRSTYFFTNSFPLLFLSLSLSLFFLTSYSPSPSPSLCHSKSIGSMGRRSTDHSLSLSPSTAPRPKFPAYTVSTASPVSPSRSPSTPFSQMSGTGDGSQNRSSTVGERHTQSQSQSQSPSPSRIGTGTLSGSVGMSTTLNSTWPGQLAGDSGSEKGRDRDRDRDRDREREREREREGLDSTLAGLQGW